MLNINAELNALWKPLKINTTNVQHVWLGVQDTDADQASLSFCTNQNLIIWYLKTVLQQ